MTANHLSIGVSIIVFLFDRLIDDFWREAGGETVHHARTTDHQVTTGYYHTPSKLTASCTLKSTMIGRNISCYYAFVICVLIACFASGFSNLGPSKMALIQTNLMMAKITEKEASSAINKVVLALQKDKEANLELGKLIKTNNVLGFGSPRPGVVAVRFNASFQKQGMGRSSVPLPFGLGQSNKAEGRGTMVGQVKASVDEKSGKILECSVFRDLGYGRSFSMKV